MKQKFISLYINIADLISKMSYSLRNKVGCIIVKNNNILSFGYNGTPTGFDNCCEIDENTTKSEVIHSEMNAIAKAASEGISIKDSIVFITLSPCFDCAKALIQCKIKEIYYLDEYRITEPIQMLQKANIKVYRINKKGEILNG